MQMPNLDKQVAAILDDVGNFSIEDYLHCNTQCGSIKLTLTQSSETKYMAEAWYLQIYYHCLQYTSQNQSTPRFRYPLLTSGSINYWQYCGKPAFLTCQISLDYVFTTPLVLITPLSCLKHDITLKHISCYLKNSIDQASTLPCQCHLYWVYQNVNLSGF